jgi:hypothetical protein
VKLLFPVPHDHDNTNGATSSDAGWHWMNNVIPASSGSYDSYKDGVFYGIKPEEQNRDWDPANGEGPTGYPLWWGMINTINGTIDYKSNEGNLLKAFQETTTFVSEEDKKNNPYYEQRKLITTVMANEAVPALLDSKSKFSGKLKSIRDEYAARMILGDQSDFDKSWDEYVNKMMKSGLEEVLAEATEWYNNNK